MVEVRVVDMKEMKGEQMRKEIKIKSRNNKGSIFGARWGNWVSEVVAYLLSIILLVCACLVYVTCC